MVGILRNRVILNFGSDDFPRGTVSRSPPSRVTLNFPNEGSCVRSLYLLAALIVIGICPAWADPLSLSYAVMGTGGTSQPIAGFSGSSFEWANNTGTVAGSVLTAYGFDPLQTIPGVTADYWINNDIRGSLLLSSTFSLNGTQTLDVTTMGLTLEGQDYVQIEFALLLENSQVAAVLTNTRPDGIDVFGDIGVTPSYTAPSAGVNTVSQTGTLSSIATIGGVDYGRDALPGDCGENCYTEISSSYTPNAGQYQLLFGSFTSDGSNNRPGAVIVQSVSVPEEGTLPDLLVLGFMAVLWMGWRKYKPVMGRA